MNRESGGNTNDKKKIFMYLAYILAGVWVISFFLLICLINTIRKAVAIVKTACVAVKDMPLMLLVPVIFTIFVFAHLLWWLYSFATVYSVGTIVKSNHGPWATV